MENLEEKNKKRKRQKEEMEKTPTEDESEEDDSCISEWTKEDLLKKLEFNEECIKNLEDYKFEEILELTEQNLKDMFGVFKGILYSKRISKLKESIFHFPNNN